MKITATPSSSIKTFLTTSALALLVLMTSCSKQTPPPMLSANEHAPNRTDAIPTLTRSNPGEPASLDPHLGAGVTDGEIQRDLFEGLVNIGVNGEPVPGVAESWSSNDGLEYVFHLHEDAHWSNGDPVTAQDFVFSWRRLVDPATASPFAWLLEAASVTNAGDIIAGKKSPETLGVRAKDEHTLEVTVKRPVSYFLSMLVTTALSPLHQKTLEMYGDRWTRPGNLVGNGAFTLTDWTVGESIELEKNQHYWAKDRVRLQRVKFLPLTSSKAALSRYLTGEIDLLFELPSDHIESLRNERPKELIGGPILSTRYYYIQTTQEPLDNSKLRKALAYAIDREVIANKVYRDDKVPAYSVVPPNLPGATSTHYRTDWSLLSQAEREKHAKLLYAEAGFGPEKTITIRLLHRDSDLSVREAVAVASMWKRVLGVESILEQREWKSFWEQLTSGDYDIAMAGYTGDYNAPSTMLLPQTSDNPSNYARYSNIEFDRLIKDASATDDEKVQEQLYLASEEILAEDMPLIPVFHYSNLRLLKPHVRGYQSNALDKIYSKDLWLELDQDSDSSLNKATLSRTSN